MGHIVETPGVLSGKPRIEGTRIGVQHVVAHVNTGSTIDEVACEEYPSLTVEQVRAAVEWAREHPVEMTRERLEDDLAYHEAQVEKLNQEIDWLGEECPHCGENILTKSEDIPDGVGLLTCEDCGNIATNKLERGQVSSQS